MDTFIKIIGAIVLVIIAAIVLALLISIPVWLLWNWLIPVLFPGAAIAQSITLMQALGLTLLCSFLFKSSSVSDKSS